MYPDEEIVKQFEDDQRSGALHEGARTAAGVVSVFYRRLREDQTPEATATYLAQEFLRFVLREGAE